MADALGVDGDLGKGGFQVQAQLQALILYFLLQQIHGLGQKAARGLQAQLQDALARLQAPQIQEVFQDGVQALAVVADRDQELLLLGRQGAQDVLEQEVGSQAQ